MDELTQRQIQILKSVVEEYIKSAEPVGSDVIEKKYNVGLSPATIRNEMSSLVQKGYLRQPHTSAGRTPTSKGLKFYISQLMEEKKLSVAEEVAAKEKVWGVKNDFDKMMHEVTRSLAQTTHSVAVAATENGDVWHAGYSNILESPEFYNIDVTSRVLSLLEEVSRLQEIFFKQEDWDGPVEIFLGEELGWPNLECVGIIASRFKTSRGDGSLGVIGPARCNYPTIIPIVRYFGDLISESAWQK